MDLGKREDEFGLPTLITNPNNYKDKEVSYFLGIPLPKRTGVSDNNFSFRTLNSSQVYVMYYKGNYANRAKVIQQLLQKAKSNTMRTGDLQQTFLETPSEDGNVSMKFSLVVY
jgi:effector-binding domain-containing protein